MYCPESIILNSKFVFIILHTKADYLYYQKIPWGEKLNLLRYEFIIAPFTKFRTVINHGGRWAVKFSNFTWDLSGTFKCPFGYHRFFGWEFVKSLRVCKRCCVHCGIMQLRHATPNEIEFGCVLTTEDEALINEHKVQG